MGKDTTSLPEVWVITGIGYSDERKVLTVCPTEEDAQNAVHYYSKHYDDVDYECFYQETYDSVPVYYGGGFSAEIRPYKDDTYLLGQVRMTQSQRPVDEGLDPKDYESISFALISKIYSNKDKSCELNGTYVSAKEIPIKTDINVGKAAKEWLMNKVNEKGVIKLVIPDFDE